MPLRCPPLSLSPGSWTKVTEYISEKNLPVFQPGVKVSPEWCLEGVVLLSCPWGQGQESLWEERAEGACGHPCCRAGWEPAMREGARQATLL